MRWNFDDLLTFLEVVEVGGVTAAARRLNLSKSVVSKRVSDLEAALGVSLLQRSARRVQPTEQGRALFERMRGALRGVEDAFDAVTDGHAGLSGRLRVTVPVSFGVRHLGAMLAEFTRLHPGLEMTVDLDDRMLPLAEDGYDLAVRIGQLGNSSLVGRKLCTSPRVVCCSPDYARDHGLPRTLDEIAGHECIGYAHAQTSWSWQFEPAKPGAKPRSVRTRGRFVTNNGDVILDAAVAGLGLAMIPRFIAAPALRAGALLPVLPGERPTPDTVHAVYPPARHLPRRTRALLDALASRLQHEAA